MRINLLGFVLLILAMIALAVMAGIAKAQQAPPCSPNATMTAMLLDKYREQIVGAGMSTGNKWPVVIYSSPEGDTFTIAIRRPDGLTCLLMSGTGWVTIEPSKVINGDDL